MLLGLGGDLTGGVGPAPHSGATRLLSLAVPGCWHAPSLMQFDFLAVPKVMLAS